MAQTCRSVKMAIMLVLMLTLMVLLAPRADAWTWLEKNRSMSGLSTETKPNTGSGVTFFETDTQDTYQYDGRVWFLSKPKISSSKDAGSELNLIWGISGAVVASADMSGSDTAVTDAPTSGKTITPCEIHISTDTSMLVSLKEETSGKVLYAAYVAAYTPISDGFRGLRPLDTANKKIMCRTSTAGNIRVLIGYTED